MKSLKEFKMSLQNNESIVITNGLFWFSFVKIKDELVLQSFSDELLHFSLDTLTWDFNLTNICLCYYELYLSLLEGYNSSKDSRAYHTYNNTIECLNEPKIEQFGHNYISTTA